MERLYMRRELYFSIVLDRAAGGPIIVASTCGGTSIEDVAARSPELIMKVGGLVRGGAWVSAAARARCLAGGLGTSRWWGVCAIFPGHICWPEQQ
jgi:succinyl-CoA synthetase beta subunit